MSFSSAIRPEINLFYGNYGLWHQNIAELYKIEWVIESNLLKYETYEMICGE